MATTGSPFEAPPTERYLGLQAAEIRVEPFAAHHLPLVAAFSERYWSRPRTEAFYRWRYLDSQPFSRMFLALTDAECLGMVFGLRKPYLIGGERTSCLEVFDWHCLPGLKGSGVGIRVMRAMMRVGERVISIGGTEDVLKTLPALGWQRIGGARMYELPLSADFLESGLRRRLPVRVPGERILLHAAAVTWFRPRRRTRRPLGRIVSVPVIDLEAQPLYQGETGYDVLQLPDAQLQRWTSSGCAGTGHFGFFHFASEGRLRGWAMTRVHDTPQGREAAILDVFAPEPDVALYTWMVSEAAFSLARARPHVIRARASCPILQAALCANRFRPDEAETPVYTWPKTLRNDLRLHITLNHSDGPLRPYPLPGDATGLLAKPVDSAPAL